MVNSSYSQNQSYQNPKIDHILIAVDNLDSAIVEYKNYGFTVIYAGSSKDALNALIFLRDGTAIELIGKDRFPHIFTFLNNIRFTRLFGIMKDRISAFRDIPVGLFNYSLYTEDLHLTYKYLKFNGLKVAKPVSFTRQREDLINIKWELIGLFPNDLPFFIGNYSPSRLSDTSFIIHKNHAVAIDSLVIETNSFDKYYQIYNVIYNQKPQIHQKDTFRTCIYRLIDNYVILQEDIQIHSFFTKKDQSAPIRVSIKCEGSSYLKPGKLNDFITLRF